MKEDPILTKAFREAKAADVVRVPPLARIAARVEYATELQRRRRFTSLVVCGSALSVVCTIAVILLAPRAFPLSLPSWISPMLALCALTATWCMGGEEDGLGVLGSQLR